jgi:hypothetical protein
LIDDGGNYGIFIENGGEVGIGAAAGSPNTALELNSGARTSTFDAGNNLTWTNMLLLNPTDTINAAVGINFLVNNSFATTAGAGIAGVKSHATNAQMDLVFITDPTGGDPASSIPVERMRLLHNGNVGINTSAPAAKLEVKGNASYIRSNTASTASYSGISFAENGTTKAYISYVGSTFATAGRQSTLELRATAGIAFFADNASNADVFFRTNGQVGIGPNQWTATVLPEAALHVKGAGVDVEGDPALLEIEATTNNAVIYLKSSGSATPGYIINSYNSIFIGSTKVATGATHLQISKTTGNLIVGGPLSDYTYPLTVGTGTTAGTGVKPTIARFIGYNSTVTGASNGKSFLVMTSTTTNPQLGIAYQANGPGGGTVEWLSGSFYAAGPTSFFGWRYLGGSSVTDPDNSAFHSSAIKNNTAYISSADLVSVDIAECQGGLNAANTPAAYGTMVGDGGTGVNGSGQYNLASAVITGGTGNVITITFKKEIDNATITAATPNPKGYTITAIGWDGTNSQVIVGKPTVKSKTAVTLTFYPTDVDLEDTVVYWTWSILGGKHNP